MSEHTHHVKPKSPDDPSFQLPACFGAAGVPLAVAGAVLLIGGVLLGLFGGPGADDAARSRFTMSSYLVAFFFCFTLSLGCMFFVLIQYLVRAGWSVVVRRTAELFMIAMPALAILFLPILFAAWSSAGMLFPWSDPGFGVSHHLPAELWREKVRYLNPEWFSVRAIVYLVALSAIAIYYFRLSRRQDDTGEITLTERMQGSSGLAVIVFSLVTSFVAFDWLMSLAPMWFSTMFGVYIFAGSVLAAHCLVALSCYLLQRRGAIRDEVTIEHYHDLGKYIFGFTTFWTYISFSQFLLIWYANIPEETIWFDTRLQGVWPFVSYAFILLHWLVPFLAMMSRHVRRRPGWVAGWAAYILLIHFVDLYWIVMPETGTTFGGGVGVLVTLLISLGMFGLYLGGILWFARANQVKVLPVRDPRLGESLAFENV